MFSFFLSSSSFSTFFLLRFFMFLFILFAILFVSPSILLTLLLVILVHSNYSHFIFVYATSLFQKSSSSSSFSSKYSCFSVLAFIACHSFIFICHFLQPSSMLAASQCLDQQYPGTTNIALEGPPTNTATNIAAEGSELACCEATGLQPSLLADVSGDVTNSGDVIAGTLVVAGAADCPGDSTYPTVCLYDNRPRTPSSSFRV